MTGKCEMPYLSSPSIYLPYLFPHTWRVKEVLFALGTFSTPGKGWLDHLYAHKGHMSMIIQS